MDKFDMLGTLRARRHIIARMKASILWNAGSNSEREGMVGSVHIILLQYF
jgi:hypothetical protein